MLTSLFLQNFKCFREPVTIPLSGINLLTGINGRGKSSLLQSLLLFQQSIAVNENTDRFILNGPLVEIGRFRDLQNADTSSQHPVRIGYRMATEKQGYTATLEIDFELQANQHDPSVAEVAQCNIRSNTPFHNLRERFDAYELQLSQNQDGRFQETWVGTDKTFPAPINIVQRAMFLKMKMGEQLADTQTLFALNRMHYVGADRIGPQNYYLKYQLNRFVTSDRQGTNAVNIAARFRNSPVAPPLHRAEKLVQGVKVENISPALQTQLGEWLGYVTDTPDLSIHLDDSSNDYIITLAFDFGTGGRFKPANVGFGYSYILPIIITGLVARPGEILVVENPEAHLHPRAQSRLTHFLTKVAATGVQVFIESHSDHTLNALRVAIKNEEIRPEQLNVLFFTSGQDQQTTIVHPKVDKDGRIDQWVEGFFDEWDNHLMQLM